MASSAHNGRGGQGNQSTSRNRDWIAFLLFCVVAVAVFVRLFDLQVIKANALSEEISAKRTSSITIDARRGTIYDRNGNVLATSVDATTIYANPTEIANPEATAQELAKVLGGEEADYVELLKTDGSFVYIQRKADEDKGTALKQRALELREQAAKVAKEGETVTTALSGIYYLDDWKRYYPYGSTGAQVIGFVGTDGDGLSGIELQYDEILGGTDGQIVKEYGLGGTPIAGGEETITEAEAGIDIIISLDIDLQKQVEASLLNYGTEREAEDGSATVIDGATGEILAAASLPLYSFDEDAEYVAGSESLWSIVNSYEPGSIFKTVTAAAALEENVTSIEKEYEVPAVLDFGTYQVTDAHERYETETMSLYTIMAQSSNIGISMVEEPLGDSVFYKYIKGWLFAQKTGVDYPGEASGYLSHYGSWSPLDVTSISFGQGISVSALQMTSYYGVIANDGIYMKPHFLLSINADTKTLSKEKAALVDKLMEDTTSRLNGKRFISAETCKKLDTLLIGVVQDGTGARAAVYGYTAAGKTGTAEVADGNGSYLPDYYKISFSGYMPYSQTALAMTVTYTDPTDAEVRSPAASVFSETMSYASEKYLFAVG